VRFAHTRRLKQYSVACIKGIDLSPKNNLIIQMFAEIRHNSIWILMLLEALMKQVDQLIFQIPIRFHILVFGLRLGLASPLKKLLQDVGTQEKKKTLQ
jgi:hypothetical protein